MVKIQTTRTILRRFNISDLDNMIRLESDPEVMKFTSLRLPQSIEVTTERLKALITKEASDEPLGVWAAEQKDTKDFLGWFMLKHTEFEFPEMGYMIVKEKWRQGFASEVAQALIHLGIETLGYEGVIAKTDCDNLSSIHILEKLGFHNLGTSINPDKVLGRDISTYTFELRRR